MNKIVTSGESNCYVTLTESNECAVKFDRTYRMFAVNNTSENEAIMSLSPNKSRTDDGVRIIPAGESRTLTTSGIDSDTVYINGNGSVEVAALNGNSVNPFFKGSSGGGGGGSSYIPNSEKGAAGGVATLDISGKVPAAQLPSYVDDVIDGYYYESSFYADSEHTQLIVGETGKIYNDVSTNISYRWSGTGYIAMSVQNAVTYTSQALTTEQKTQARENIGAAASDDIPTDAVKYTAQTLTTEQKTQARTNIGAGTSNFSGNYDDLDNAPDMTFIQPEISDMVDSGLGWRAQQAYYTDTAGNPQYYAQCLSYTDAYNGGYSLKINNGPSICAFIRDPNLIYGVYLLSTVESAAVINYAESRSDPVETISPVASNSWYIAGRIIDTGSYDPGKNRNYPDIVLPSDSTFRNANFGTDAATRAEAVRIILEAAHAIPPTSFNVPTVECTEQRYANAVKYTAQTLTDAQKTQARTNIGVVQPDWRQSSSSNADYIKNKPPIIAVYPGTSGSYIGGTGMNSMNEATKQNSVAYGYAVSAKGNYSSAFGYFLQALHDYEIAYGKFNQSNADTVFSIGDGTSNSDRHNLMELKTDGRMFLNGNAVKTEGGDDDDDYYPMLGQVYDWGGPGFSYYVYGFQAALSSIYDVIDIIFYSDDNRASTGYDTVFGDFRVRASTSASQTTIYLIAPNGAVVDASRPWIHVQNGYFLFNNCRITSNIVNAVSKFDTSRVKNMTRMFSLMTKSSLSTLVLDLSSFDTRKVKKMGSMFYGSTAITRLDLSSFDMSNVVDYSNMFGNSSNPAGITTLKCPKINPHNDIPLPRTLYSQDGTAYTNLPVTTGTSIELRQSWT